MSRPTTRQRDILIFIREQMDQTGYPPTIREICTAMDIKSTNGVNDHLKALERKGLISRESGKSRAMLLTELGWETTAPFVKSVRPASGETRSHDVDDERYSLATVPLLGRIAAGLPIDAIEQVEDTIVVDSTMLGRSKAEECFALRVEGFSMIEDGILDGDIVFIRRQSTASRGETVAVMVDGSATLKRYFQEPGRIRLQPANSEMEPIYVYEQDARETMILGRVVGLYRRFAV